MQDLGFPSAALLDCQYRLAESLNASGTAGVIEGYLEEWEDAIESVAGGSLKEDGGMDIGRFWDAGLWLAMSRSEGC